MYVLSAVLVSLLAVVAPPSPSPTGSAEASPAASPPRSSTGPPSPAVPLTSSPSDTASEPPPGDQTGLNITVPATVDLGTGSPGSFLAGSIGQVMVEDFRGPLNPNTWVATVTSTTFVTGPGGANRTVPTSNVRYWSGPTIRSTGGGVLVPGQLTSAQAATLDASRVAFRKLSGNGNNMVAWRPNLRINLPDGLVAGRYAGTVTHSVA